MSRPAGIAALLVALACSSAHAPAPATGVMWVQGGPYRLKTSVYRSSELSPHPVLVVVLHGDAPFNKPDYQDTFAAKVAAANSDVIVAAILRPGYTDPQGNTSEGERGQTTGDNYNARNVDAIAAAIGELRQRFQARRLVVVGHSGGAAITAEHSGATPCSDRRRAPGLLPVRCEAVARAHVSEDRLRRLSGPDRDPVTHRPGRRNRRSRHQSA